LFADDLKKICIVKFYDDDNLLQSDLNLLSKWCVLNSWIKCKLLFFNHSPSNISNIYYINNEPLEWMSFKL